MLSKFISFIINLKLSMEMFVYGKLETEWKVYSTQSAREFNLKQRKLFAWVLVALSLVKYVFVSELKMN